VRVTWATDIEGAGVAPGSALSALKNGGGSNCGGLGAIFFPGSPVEVLVAVEEPELDDEAGCASAEYPNSDSAGDQEVSAAFRGEECLARSPFVFKVPSFQASFSRPLCQEKRRRLTSDTRKGGGKERRRGEQRHSKFVVWGMAGMRGQIRKTDGKTDTYGT
jgi:hypothetical protein